MKKRFLAITLSILLGLAILTPKPTGGAESVQIEIQEECRQEGQLRPSGLTTTAKDKAFMKIYGGLSTSDVTNIWNDFMFLEHMTEIREVHIFINSGGGSAFAGLALADTIRKAQNNGFKVTGHASGLVASATVPVFAVCNVRIASPGTIFMVHEASLWKWPGQESASDIRAQGELMKLLQERYLGILVDRTNLSHDQWLLMEARTTWFDTDKALEIGLVDKIE